MSETRSPSSTPTGRPSFLPDVEAGSSPKRPSPLNPNATPLIRPKPLHTVSDDDATIRPSSPPLRGRATSISDGGLPTDHHAKSTPGTSSLSLPLLNDELRSTSRERSKSPGPTLFDASGQEGEENLKSSWWAEKHVSRPWQDSPKRKQTVPKEQTEAFQSTRSKVAQAVASVLDISADVVYEALFLGVDLLQLAPVPGLAEAAKTLLNIWDAVKQIDMYRLASLRLTERCADILLSIRHEVQEAGDVVGEELAPPIAKLEESYLSVHRFMLRQIQRPWLKRYLKRSETLNDIAACDNLLRDALSLFSVSIQIRILKLVQESDRRRRADIQSMTEAAFHTQLPFTEPDTKLILNKETAVTTSEPSSIESSTEYTLETSVEYATTRNALGLVSDKDEIDSPFPVATIEPAQGSGVIPAIQTMQVAQNSLDAALDSSDLRQLMRAALQAGSDAEMLEVLQVKRKEMPDAIKALQRALDRLPEQEEQPIGKGVVLGKIVRRISTKNSEGKIGPKRSTTIISIESESSSSESGASSEQRKRDTLDSEFIESGIDALWRMSRGIVTTVPNWTITKYEVDRDEKIGVGFFSDVYKGTWRDRTVAIKVLAESTPRALFVREIGIWKTLQHINVLPLYGASSATNDPPWFFVSPYMKNGSLVEYLRRIETEMRPPGLGVGSNQSLPTTPFRGRTPTLPQGSPADEGNGIASTSSTGLAVPLASRSPSRGDNIQREWDLFRMMYEIAKGMAYLHNKGVLHGDLKAANVLVDDKYRCVISDFGQSEMKFEAYRISGSSPHGTLRWQSPERMSGKSQLTPADDVWAFSICCVEVLNMGRLPWPLMDDNTVRYFVLTENSRPAIPKNSRFNTPAIQDILRSCWTLKPEQRPPFSKISSRLRLLRKSSGYDVSDSPALPSIPEKNLDYSPSPDLRPQDSLPAYVQSAPGPIPNELLDASLIPDLTKSRRESTVVTAENTVSEEVTYVPAPSGSSSRTSSVSLEHDPEEETVTVFHIDGYESPPPVDERMAQIKNERRYRLLLTHDYHPSLTCPLWSPTPVALSAVGYLSKPKGEFITLFSAYSPDKALNPLIKKLPSIEGYGHAGRAEVRQDRRTVTQWALDLFKGGILTFGNLPKQLSRRYSFPLKAGHKVAYLCAETTQYEYMESLDAPRKWFQMHVDTIMKAYGHEHRIQREDLVLVIGALRVPNYGLFVSHSHPEGHVHFSVYAGQKVGQPWGTFTTDTNVAPGTGPTYFGDEPDIPRISASKVSRHGDPEWSAVLLSRLRFKPDAVEPTSKK